MNSRNIVTKSAALCRSTPSTASIVAVRGSATQLHRSSSATSCGRCLRNESRNFLQSSVRRWLNISSRQLAELEDLILTKVGPKVHDPVLGQDLKSLQWIHKRMAVSDDGSLNILLRLPSLLHPALDELKENVRQYAQEEYQQWLQQRVGNNNEKNDAPTAKVNVEALPSKPIPVMARLVEDQEELMKSLGPGLVNVSHFLAVYSCKGGVGKSTVAVNLAYELARMGGRVGLLDLDVYGPSLPVLVKPDDKTVRVSPVGKGMVYPIEHKAVRMLSLGFVSRYSGVQGSGQDNGAAIMRGPLTVKVVSQLLKGTDWGDLDVLVLDLPPGTGDVQLAVLQDLQLSGAVAVSTPSKLAIVDTQKGIEMFTSLGVPTLALVENMSYFVCEGGTTHYPFGKGFMENMTTSGSAGGRPLPSSVVQLPISTLTNSANDSGEPVCLSRPEGSADELRAFGKLARNVSQELLKIQYGYEETKQYAIFESESDSFFDVSSVQLQLDKSSSTSTEFVLRIFSEKGALEVRIQPPQLRSRDPKTGDIVPDSPFLDEKDENSNDGDDDSAVKVHRSGSRKRSPSVLPGRVVRKGRYGYGVEWGDGATIIYSMACLVRAAGGELQATPAAPEDDQK